MARFGFCVLLCWFLCCFCFFALVLVESDVSTFWFGLQVHTRHHLWDKESRCVGPWIKSLKLSDIFSFFETFAYRIQFGYLSSQSTHSTISRWTMNSDVLIQKAPNYVSYGLNLYISNWEIQRNTTICYLCLQPTLKLQAKRLKHRICSVFNITCWALLMALDSK